MNNLTISDIAKEAGVSKATVSRVINNTASVSPETRQRVLAVIEERQFVPSTTARNLSGGKSSAIGFVVPDIDNPFFGEILRGAMETTDKHNLTLIFYNTDDNQDKDKKALRLLKENNVAGILYTPAIDYSEPEEREQLQEMLEELNVPVVIMDRNIGLKNYDLVYFNDYQGMYEATERLIQAGHRKIGLINATLDRVLARERQAGYLDALAAAGIPIREDYIFYGDYHSSLAYVLARKMLAMEDRPTAVLTSNNRTTIGFLRALCERGEEVPRDIVCVGLDKIEMLETIKYPLNYIERDARQMGREAATLLFSRMMTPGCPITEVTLDTRVVMKHMN